MKMAYAPLPQLACKPVDTSRMCPKDLANSSLADVLNSESVKRLLNQPNLVIKTVPLNPIGLKVNSAMNKNASNMKKNGMNFKLIKPKRSGLSVIPFKVPQKNIKEEKDLLPSNIEGKSEIAILPIKHEKKPCGHVEACENIICEVAVQQYVDRDGVSPMIATGIEDDDINAPVAKHCSNKNCDALSIDHDRCRRVSIKLHRFDKANACDICGIRLKTRKSRAHHKNCTRKDVYRHNDIDCAQLLKERMREREIQLMEAIRSKRNDYLDPVTENSRAMEALKNNEELIIIPTTSTVEDSYNSTTIPTRSISQRTNATNVFGKLLPSFPIVLPQQNTVVLGKTLNSEDNSQASLQIKTPDIINAPFVANTTTASDTPTRNQFIAVSATPQTPLALNNWVLSQTPLLTSSGLQSKPFLTPLRVVPITNIITQPSLLHQTQGIPKFCIMTNNTVAPIPITGTQMAQPPAQISPVKPTPSISTEGSPKDFEKDTKVIKQEPKRVPKRRRGAKGSRKPLRRNWGKKKDFKCTFCTKRFSTEWYFKMHVAMHKGEKRFKCQTCPQSFMNRYDVRKHMLRDHSGDNFNCDVCYGVSLSYSEYETHMKTHCEGRHFKCFECNLEYTAAIHLRTHRRKYHKLAQCKYCRGEFLQNELQQHITDMHTVSGDSTSVKNESEVEEKEEVADEENENGNMSEENSETGDSSKAKDAAGSMLKKMLTEREQKILGPYNCRRNGYVRIAAKNNSADNKDEADSQIEEDSEIEADSKA